MTWQTWWLFTVTELALCLTPGPAVLFVVSQALAHGAARSAWASAGILTSNALYFGLSALGLGAVLAASHEVFLVIKYAGALYLVYLAVTMIAGRGLMAEPAEAARATPSGLAILGRGAAVQAANPKALLFFTALLPQFVSPAESIAWQLVVLGVTSVVVEFLVLLTYGIVAGRAAPVLRQPRYARATNVVASGLLLGAAIGLASAGQD